jgi:hypothetical protein
VLPHQAFLPPLPPLLLNLQGFRRENAIAVFLLEGDDSSSGATPGIHALVNVVSAPDSWGLLFFSLIN